MAQPEYYNQLLKGDAGALKRALYKSMGFTDEALSKPLIAIVNTYTDATTGHENLARVQHQVEKGIEAAGGTAMTFGTIAPCDGIAEGHDGMRYILPARDLITSSVECMVRAHRFDGMVLLGSCDKIVPGLLMAAARLNIPSIFCNGGPMLPACYRGKHYDGNIVTEAVGWKKRGLINQDEFTAIENLAEPCVGSCAMLGTANTMSCLAEAMGMSLPGSAAIPAIYSKRMQIAYETGRAVMELVRNKINARDIMTEESLQNAITVLIAMGGSTNGILHLQAIWKEAGCGKLPLIEFDKVSKKTPQIASIYPASPYDMVDFYEAGGVQAIMQQLRPLLHLDCLTATGHRLKQNLENCETPFENPVIKTLDNPFRKDGGIVILQGNLAPDGAVAKPAAIPDNMLHITGKAVVFESEDEACSRILTGEINKGSVLVLRYEGPKGGPGMPEMYRPMKCLEGMNISDSCALITDGRFSGSNRGCFVGHISPEAYEGGNLALVEDGDEIEIDIPNRKIELLVKDSNLKKRKEKWKAPEKELLPGYLNIYRRISHSAADGAIVD